MQNGHPSDHFATNCDHYAKLASTGGQQRFSGYAPALLPKMSGVFGKWDWAANGALYRRRIYREN
jgi:hypothetical protein